MNEADMLQLGTMPKIVLMVAVVEESAAIASKRVTWRVTAISPVS